MVKAGRLRCASDAASVMLPSPFLLPSWSALLQAFDAMNNPISPLRFTCAPTFSSRINLVAQHQD
jgi:hypothetical protein